MTHSWATSQKLLLSTMPRVCTYEFLALVGRQKFLFQLILWMILELVLMTSPHPFSFLFCKLEGRGGELGTCPSVILCLAGLYKGAKLEVGAGISLISRSYRGVISSNTVVFTVAGVGDVQANLFTTKGVANAKVTKDLFYFIYDNRRRDKIPSKVTDLFSR